MKSNLYVWSLAPLVALSACSRGERSAPSTAASATPALKVETAPVTLESVPRVLLLTGSLSGDRQSEVAANVQGRVAATLVERGQAVKKGDVLVIVDARAAGFSAAAALAQSQAADTQVELARQECARADTLFSQGAIPRTEYDRLKTQCTAQLYQANAARANAELAGKLAGDTVIRAPIDGFVGERMVNVGEYVQPATRVATVYAIDPIRVTISVPESSVGSLKEGQTLTLRVAAWPNRDFPAVVKYVSPALRPLTRDLLVEASAPNADKALKPGMFATVTLTTGEETLPTVPLTALRAEGATRRLFLVSGKEAQERVVRTGVQIKGRVAILDTLTDKDTVILNPPAQLRDGAALQ